MDIDSVVGFLTSKTGIVAAVVVVLGLVAAVLKIILPLLQRKDAKQAALAVLSISEVRVEDPPPHTEAGSATFELMNAQGGKAIMSELLLQVTDHGPSETPKMVEAAAPVPQFTYKVTLNPETTEYDVRKREFGSATPHSYEKAEVESFLIELRSTTPQWYEFQFLIRWYDSNKPAEIHDLITGKSKIEFKPGIEDLLD